MSQIRILPDMLANKIAAGEVVERPAAVVKELVENALDARSDRIAIEVHNGGRSLIQVADNGTGMSHDDALLSVERFATSKLRTDEDLAAIRTLGFRGEALPSIAAVSKLTLVTREEGAANGVRIEIDAGAIQRVMETGAPQGTLVQVARLFFNTPARRKFLKSVATEMGHIADTVAGLAVACPDVHVTLTHNGKTVRQWPRAVDGMERAAGVLGQSGPGDLIALEARGGGAAVSGWIAPPRLARNTGRGSFLFVNGRRVRDRIIQHALFEGFQGRLMKGRFPLAALFLMLPFDQVDVNVHPTKHEVRFAHPRQVHELVRDAVRQALGDAERRMWGRARTDAGRVAGHSGIVAEPAAAYRTGLGGSSPPAESPGPFHPGPEVPARRTPCVAPQDSADPAKTGRFLPAKAAQQPLWTAGRFADLAIIGQLLGTYIICQDGDGLMLIDQHAAHERVVFEALSGRRGQPESQRLLVPETVVLGFAEARAIDSLIGPLAELGLEIEPFGGTTIAVKAIPSLLGHADVPALVRELAERSAGLGLAAGVDRILAACRMVMACHHAVRGNQRLTEMEIRALLDALDRCDSPGHCPHGRPTWVRWTRRDLDSAFGRGA